MVMLMVMVFIVMMMLVVIIRTGLIPGIGNLANRIQKEERGPRVRRLMRRRSAPMWVLAAFEQGVDIEVLHDPRYAAFLDGTERVPERRPQVIIQGRLIGQ